MASPAKSWYLLLTAAGSSSRFAEGKKEFRDLGGKTVLRRSLDPFLALPGLEEIVVTHPKGRENETRESLGVDDLTPSGTPLFPTIGFVEGGETRQESVRKGLEHLGSRGDGKDAIVLVHDGARPWASPELVSSVLHGALSEGACVPLVDLADTPKIIGQDSVILDHPSRSKVKAAQTPQGFRLQELLKAHRTASEEGWACTDDSSLWHRYVGPVHFVPGAQSNRKITYREDLMPLEPERAASAAVERRIGEGWDIHPLTEGRALLLGGLKIDFPKGEAGHSDGDVLWHCVMDALLGAAGLGDIGFHFPPSEAEWKDADSSGLARHAAALVRGKGWEIENIDATVVIERPRLSSYKEAIRENMARVLGVDPGRISIKAKTYEGFGEVGQGRAVQARAVALLIREGGRPSS